MRSGINGNEKGVGCEQFFQTTAFCSNCSNTSCILPRSPTWDGAIAILNKIPTDFGWSTVGEVVASNYKYYLVLVGGYLIHWVPSKYKGQLRTWVSQSSPYVLFLLALASSLVIYQILSAEVQPFIYFAF